MTFEKSALFCTTKLAFSDILFYTKQEPCIMLLDRKACEKLFKKFPPANTENMDEYIYSEKFEENDFEIINNDITYETDTSIFEINIKPIISKIFFIDSIYKINKDTKEKTIFWYPCGEKIIYFE